MKDLIRQILREETSGLTDGQIKAGYALMNMITKGYHWYHDTPEQPFGHTPGSIWLINPDTKQWMLELKKSGNLWYWDFYLNFRRYFNMEVPDFKKFITIWVEDVINRGVSSTNAANYDATATVEDVIKRGKQIK